MMINPYAVILMLSFFAMIKTNDIKTNNKYEKTTNDTSTFFVDSTGIIR